MNGANHRTSSISDAGGFADSPLDETDLAPGPIEMELCELDGKGGCDLTCSSMKLAAGH